ncbi:MAG: hypothetical protein ACI9DC_001194 [Gammaproteobacteria bacterium]|jgi:hypothetical protein
MRIRPELNANICKKSRGQEEMFLAAVFLKVNLARRYLKVIVSRCSSLLVEILGVKLMRLPTRE